MADKTDYSIFEKRFEKGEYNIPGQRKEIHKIPFKEYKWLEQNHPECIAGYDYLTPGEELFLTATTIGGGLVGLTMLGWGIYDCFFG